MKKVFIDGSAGTTGLRIYERLAGRDDIELIVLPEDKRKDAGYRAEALNSSDAAFLCLPDDAARETVALTNNPNTVLIDTSTAHRTADGWAYGFPELGEEFEQRIAVSKRIAVPGCHASGFIALVYPLVKNGFISKNENLSCFSLTGYSGGGKKMIAEYQSASDSLFNAPRVYGLTQSHKHLKEMQSITGIECTPVFIPTVGNFYSGMEVCVPLFGTQLKNGRTIQSVKELYSDIYSGIVKYVSSPDENGFMSAGKYSGTDGMEISVSGNDERMVLTARYDNLGKGASGAAVECLNLSLNTEKTKGLVL